MKTVIQIILAALIIVLGVVLFQSIRKPIQFDKEKNIRYDAAKQKLEDIRTAQVSYKDVHGHFTPNFEELINFVNTDSFQVQSVTRVVDYNTDDISKTEAIKLGFYKISTSKISVKDSLFKNMDYPFEEIKYVPFTNDQDIFFMDTATVQTGSGVEVPVFEAHVKNYVLLNGLDEQLAINFNDKWKQIAGDFSGLRVGSLVEATNNAGNW